MPPVAEENCQLLDFRLSRLLELIWALLLSEQLGTASGASGRSLAATLNYNATKLTLPGQVAPASAPLPVRG